MNIALFGYGKMGRMLEKIGQERTHTIVAKIDVDSSEVNFSNIDVAIDFSTPDAAFGNIAKCLKNNIPIISGTTGWLDNYNDALQICKEQNGAFLYASNFSLGVNIFFALNQQLAKMMAPLDQYKTAIEEIHHIHKLDAPSGTAISLAEGIISETSYESWLLDSYGNAVLPIHSKREGEVPGTHSVSYESSEDTLEIKHTAHGREGFALGAMIAAEWIVGKKGVFSMKDVLNLNNIT